MANLKNYANAKIDYVYECRECGNVVTHTDYDCPCGTLLGWRCRDPHPSDMFWLHREVDWDLVSPKSCEDLYLKLKEKPRKEQHHE